MESVLLEFFNLMTSFFYVSPSYSPFTSPDPSRFNRSLVLYNGGRITVPSRKLGVFCFLGNGYVSRCSRECLCNPRCQNRCRRRIVSRINSGGDNRIDSTEDERTNGRKKFNLMDFFKNIESNLRKNPKKVMISAMISVSLALCILLLKLTSMPTPKLVCYSDFVTKLQNGGISEVLFEEGTPRILYKTVAYEKSEEPSEAVVVVEPEATKKGRTPFKLTMTAIITAASKARTKKKNKSIPEWSFTTRKIKHNENFLFDLMREKGTKYGSAPQSPIALLRNALLALLTLWIPLAPILWLLHRQLSPSNTAAKKKRPKNQLVGFNDVEGVDAAKEELLEVIIPNLPYQLTFILSMMSFVPLSHLNFHIFCRLCHAYKDPSISASWEQDYPKECFSSVHLEQAKHYLPVLLPEKQTSHSFRSLQVSL